VSKSRTATQAADDIELATLGSALWRAKGWILGLALLAGAVTFIGLSMVRPLYTSEARILIQSDESAFTSPTTDQTPEPRTSLDEQAVQSQVQVLNSRDLLLHVVKDLNLTYNAAFAKNVGETMLKQLLARIGIGTPQSEEERAANALAYHLDVFQLAKSSVIAVEYTSGSPDLAAKVADKLADVYIAWQRDAKIAQTKDASDWLEAQIKALRKATADSEEAVEKYKASQGLYAGSNNGALSAQQLKSELADVRAQIRDEASKVVGSLENEAHVAAAREASLKASLNAAKTSSAGLSDSAIKLRALEREAKANRDLLDTHLARYRDASSRHNMGAVPAQATIVSRAHASVLSSFPKRGPLTLLVMVATALLPFAYVLAREFISGSTQAAPRLAQQSHHKPRHRERVLPAAVETPLIQPAPTPKTNPAASAPQPERKKVAGGSAAWVLPARKLPVVIPTGPPVSAPRQAAAEAKEPSEAKSEAPSTPSTPPSWKAKPAQAPRTRGPKPTASQRQKV